MNVLAIGNSFSEDAVRYLYGIARADGKQITVANLFIPGCPLDKHYRNMLSDSRAYELQINGHRTGFSVSLSEALLSREWDVVTFQQASHKSFNKDSYVPYITELAAYVRKCCPKTKIYVHQTWSYEAGSNRLFNIAKYDTPENMLSDVKAAYSFAAKSIDAYGIIPSGELFAKLLESGIEKVHRDTFHASLGLGRYALGLLWYSTLFTKCVSENSFCDLDEEIGEEQMRIVKSCVDSFLTEKGE